MYTSSGNRVVQASRQQGAACGTVCATCRNSERSRRVQGTARLPPLVLARGGGAHARDAKAPASSTAPGALTPAGRRQAAAPARPARSLAASRTPGTPFAQSESNTPRPLHRQRIGRRPPVYHLLGQPQHALQLLDGGTRLGLGWPAVAHDRPDSGATDWCLQELLLDMCCARCWCRAQEAGRGAVAACGIRRAVHTRAPATTLRADSARSGRRCSVDGVLHLASRLPVAPATAGTSACQPGRGPILRWTAAPVRTRASGAFAADSALLVTNATA